jgi:glycerol-3-phosphate dehydrogenase
MAIKPQDLIYRRTRLGFLDNEKVISKLHSAIVDIYAEELKWTKEQKENFLKENFQEIRKLDF